MIRPDFYYSFTCLADQCRHSCCKGWEIDIDPSTAAFYENLPGKLGDEIRENIDYDEEGCHFLMKEDICPFLKQDGLCRLIQVLGEEALCDICALHPRFFFDVGKLEFGGLGLSCEGVCRFILSEEELLFFDDETGETYSVTDLLYRIGLFPRSHSMMTPDHRHSSDHEKHYGSSDHTDLNGLSDHVYYSGPSDYAKHSGPPPLLFIPRPSFEDYSDILNLYEKMEPIDQRWTRDLSYLRKNLSDVTARSTAYLNSYRQEIYQRIFDYILYRQLENAKRYGLEKILNFTGIAAEFIFMTDALWKDTGERLRRWSEQVEYSTKNVAIVLDSTHIIR